MPGNIGKQPGFSKSIPPSEAMAIAVMLRHLHWEQTAKQLIEMGDKFYTGMEEFSATSVRAILRNETNAVV